MPIGAFLQVHGEGDVRLQPASASVVEMGHAALPCPAVPAVIGVRWALPCPVYFILTALFTSY